MAKIIRILAAILTLAGILTASCSNVENIENKIDIGEDLIITSPSYEDVENNEKENNKESQPPDNKEQPDKTENTIQVITNEEELEEFLDSITEEEIDKLIDSLKDIDISEDIDPFADPGFDDVEIP